MASDICGITINPQWLRLDQTAGLRTSAPGDVNFGFDEADVIVAVG
jgi:hypothetical protein